MVGPVLYCARPPAAKGTAVQVAKIIAGNLLFGVIAAVWLSLSRRAGVELERTGVIFILAAFIAGTFMGHALGRKPRKPMKKSGLQITDFSVFDRIK